MQSNALVCSRISTTYMYDSAVYISVFFTGNFYMQFKFVVQLYYKEMGIPSRIMSAGYIIVSIITTTYIGFLHEIDEHVYIAI